MEQLQNEEDPGDPEQLLYEKVEDFKYLGATLNTINDQARKIGICISKEEKVFFTLATLQVQNPLKKDQSKTIDGNNKINTNIRL